MAGPTRMTRNWPLAAIMAGPEAHPDRDRRWIAAVAGGVSYLLLGLGAGAAAGFIESASPLLIEAVAGLALIGAFVTGLVSAFASAEHRLAAAATFLVVASGIAIAGIGSAFWGLVVGGAVYLALRPRSGADRANVSSEN